MENPDWNVGVIDRQIRWHDPQLRGFDSRREVSCVAGQLTLLHPKMELLWYREARELETQIFLHFPWCYDYQIRVQSISNFKAIEPGKMGKIHGS